MLLPPTTNTRSYANCSRHCAAGGCGRVLAINSFYLSPLLPNTYRLILINNPKCDDRIRPQSTRINQRIRGRDFAFELQAQAYPTCVLVASHLHFLRESLRLSGGDLQLMSKILVPYVPPNSMPSNAPQQTPSELGFLLPYFFRSPVAQKAAVTSGATHAALL